MVTVLRRINQKGLYVQSRKLAKTVDKLAGTLENVQKPNGPKGACSKEDQEARKLEFGQTQEMLKDAWEGCCQDVQAFEEPPVW